MGVIVGACVGSVVIGGCWLVLSLESVGGEVLGTAGGEWVSCDCAASVTLGGAGFGMGLGVWSPVLIPCCSGDLLRGAGVCVSDLSVLGESSALRLDRLVGSSVGGVEELAVETGGV
jgi:hypothetical protein